MSTCEIVITRTPSESVELPIPAAFFLNVPLALFVTQQHTSLVLSLSLCSSVQLEDATMACTLLRLSLHSIPGSDRTSFWSTHSGCTQQSPTSIRSGLSILTHRRSPFSRSQPMGDFPCRYSFTSAFVFQAGIAHRPRWQSDMKPSEASLPHMFTHPHVVVSKQVFHP